MKVKHGLPCEVGIRKEALSTDQIPRVKIWVRAYLLGPGEARGNSGGGS